MEIPTWYNIPICAQSSDTFSCIKTESKCVSISPWIMSLYEKRDMSLTLKWLAENEGRGVGQLVGQLINLIPPCGFSKNVSSKEGERE